MNYWKSHHICLIIYYCVAIMSLISTSCFGFDEEFIGQNAYYENKKKALDADRDQRYIDSELNYKHALDIIEKAHKFYPGISQGLANSYHQQGKYQLALAMKQNILLHYDPEKNPRDLPSQARNYCSLSSTYLEYGDFDNALCALRKALKLGETWSKSNKYNQTFNQNVIYPYMGEYYLQTGNSSESLEFYHKHLGALAETRQQPYLIARANQFIGNAYYSSGDVDNALKYLARSVDLNSGTIVVNESDVIRSIKLVAMTKVSQGNSKDAVGNFDSALKLARGQINKFKTNKVDEADVLLEVAKFRLRQYELASAVSAFRESAEARLSTQGPLHPAYADCLMGLADSEAMQGNYSIAREHATTALKILDASLLSTHPRIVIAVVRLCALDILNNQTNRSPDLYLRFGNIHNRPLGLWKREFTETIQFYAALLRKEGKNQDLQLFKE